MGDYEREREIEDLEVEVEALKYDRENLIAEIRNLRAALEPFARLYSLIEDESGVYGTSIVAPVDQGHGFAIDSGNIRRAAEVLSIRRASQALAEYPVDGASGNLDDAE